MPLTDSARRQHRVPHRGASAYAIFEAEGEGGAVRVCIIGPRTERGWYDAVVCETVSKQRRGGYAFVPYRYWRCTRPHRK